MTDLTMRVRAALGTGWGISCSPWEGLMHLHANDPDAFYLLACSEAGDLVHSELPEFGPLARRVRIALRASYHLLPPGKSEGQVVTRTDQLAVPAELFSRVQQFLRELDGKGISEKPGKDYEGRTVSEAAVRFQLGTPEERQRDQDLAKARREARPQGFRLDALDIASLRTLPPYVTHDLRHCARKTILAPTAVYQGLNRSGGAAQRLQDGWAICGKPTRSCDNAGKLISPPSGKVFMVFADADRYVFDWDWVEESEHAPGHPLDPELRFGRLHTSDEERFLSLPPTLPVARFDPTVATYSQRGDCIFCYASDECGYAERINPDLTVFRAFGTKDVTGFKVKNVQRILTEESLFVNDDAPDLRVSVQPILLATLKADRKANVRIYDVIIEAFRKFANPPSVLLPQRETRLADLAGR